jgi:predicted Fe-Mo cluster-binding NifX family protein
MRNPCANPNNPEELMKIAVTSTGVTPASKIDPRFGRCRQFLLYNTDTESFAALDNAQNLQAAQGAGVQAAAAVVNAGCTVLLTGHCGPKAFAALQAANVEVCSGAEGTVKEAVDAYLAGTLKPTGAADVGGHW